MWEKIFYGIPDRIVLKTNARLRRAINFWLFVIWVVPGFPIWIILHNVLWFIGFMSIYAIWGTHYGGFGTETPVEQEKKS